MDALGEPRRRTVNWYNQTCTLSAVYSQNRAFLAAVTLAKAGGREWAFLDRRHRKRDADRKVKAQVTGGGAKKKKKSPPPPALGGSMLMAGPQNWFALSHVKGARARRAATLAGAGWPRSLGVASLVGQTC